MHIEILNTRSFTAGNLGLHVDACKFDPFTIYNYYMGGM